MYLVSQTRLSLKALSVHQPCSSLQLPLIWILISNIYVPLETVNLGDTELSAMMNENWTQAKAPLLVLSCVEKETTPSLSCATVVELLQLRQLNRPWQVSDLFVLL